MVILTLTNGKTIDASSPMVLGELNPKDVSEVSYTQQTEKTSAESWAKSLNDKWKKSLVAKKVDNGKGKLPFDSLEKKTLYGESVAKLLEQIRPLVDKVNATINASHHHTLKLYIDYRGAKNGSSSEKQGTPATGSQKAPTKS